MNISEMSCRELTDQIYNNMLEIERLFLKQNTLNYFLRKKIEVSAVIQPNPNLGNPIYHGDETNAKP